MSGLRKTSPGGATPSQNPGPMGAFGAKAGGLSNPDHVSTTGFNYIFSAEGGYFKITGHTHWPKGSSGVTIGPGYDLRHRTKQEVVDVFAQIGVKDDKAAAAIAEGCGKSGADAKAFAESNVKTLVLDEEQKRALLRIVLRPYETKVWQCVRVSVRQSQYDALVSLTYNIGNKSFEKSEVLKRLNQKDYQGACKAFMLFSKTRNEKHELVPNAGLVRRREEEMRLFNSFWSGMDGTSVYRADTMWT